MTDEFEWITIGQRTIQKVRVDQIAAWYDAYMNGYQHYVYITLISGKEISGEVNESQWEKITVLL